jgi:hypothetical protein
MSNLPDYTVEFTNVTIYPELLHNAGIAWQVYMNYEVGDGSGASKTYNWTAVKKNS